MVGALGRGNTNRKGQSQNKIYSINQERNFAIGQDTGKHSIPSDLVKSKPVVGLLVVGWVTTRESRLLIVLLFGRRGGMEVANIFVC